MDIEPYAEVDTVEEFVRYIARLVARKHAPTGMVRRLSEGLVEPGMEGYATACAKYKRPEDFHLFAFLFVRYHMLERIRSLKTPVEYRVEQKDGYTVKFEFVPWTRRLAFKIVADGKVCDYGHYSYPLDRPYLGMDGLPTSEHLQRQAKHLTDRLLQEH